MLTLYQFRLSMYPEKIRWALDYKKIPHERRNLLPGPHIPYVLLRSGKTTVPMLKTEDGLITESTEILEWLEGQYPDPPLYSSDQANNQQIKAAIARADEWGVHTRRAMFHAMLPHSRYAADAFAQGVGPVKKMLYRAAFPGIRVAMKKSMNITPAAANASNKVVADALDSVAELTRATGYLVGNRFTAADLVTASCLHCVCHPEQFPARFPEPTAEGHQHWLHQWREHPGTQWVTRIYAEHRPESSAVREID